jgi:Zn finger protein HypA/HybF involved in hydrogenase expression
MVGDKGLGVMETQEQLKETVEVDTRKERKCLMCSTRFQSDGAHNRICPKCKSTEAWRRG